MAEGEAAVTTSSSAGMGGEGEVASGGITRPVSGIKSCSCEEADALSCKVTCPRSTELLLGEVSIVIGTAQDVPS